ncbi:MAG: ATP-binding protein [Bacteroidales bacterium]|nr:ATP-binding protein [Bacteroidales bacterium]
MHKSILLTILSIFIFHFIYLNVMGQKVYAPEFGDPLLEPWRWKHISYLDGKEIICVTDDTKGNIWFGSVNSLLKYDGYTFTEYIPPNKRGFFKNIQAVEQGIFVFSHPALYLFSNNEWKIIMAFDTDYIKQQKLYPAFYNVVEMPNQNYLVNTSLGILVLLDNEKYFLTDKRTILVIKDLYPDINFVEIFQDRSFTKFDSKNCIQLNDSTYRFFVNVNNSLVFNLKIRPNEQNRFIIQQSEFEKELSSKIKAFNSIISSNGVTWISSRYYKAPVYKIDNKKIVEYYPTNNLNDNNYTSNVISIDNNTVLIGGAACLYKIEDGKITRYNSPEIPISKITKIYVFKDRFDKIWLVNHRNRVFRIEYADNRWKTYKDLFFQFEDKSGKKWFISKDNKIVVNDGTNWVYYGQEHGVIDIPTRVIQTSKHDVWCSGSHAGKAATAYLKENKWIKQTHDFSWSIDKKGVFEDNQQHIWFSSYHKAIYSGEGLISLNYEKLDELKWTHYADPIYTLGGFAQNNKYLVCGTVKSAKQYNFRDKSWERLFGNGSEIDAVEKAGEHLWFGTRARGAFQLKGYYDKNNPSLIKHNLTNGLNSNTIIDIHATSDTSIWVATENGFSYYNGTDWINNCMPNQFQLENEGGEINSTNDGAIWISVLSREWSRRNSESKNINRDYGSFYSVRYNGSDDAPETKINLHFKNVDPSGNIHISWAGTDKWDHTQLNELQYSFKLDDDNWSEFSYDKSHTFFSLKSGKHTIMVRARDKDANIDRSPAIHTFVVEPPIYKQLWFVLMVLSFVLATVYLITRIISRNKKLELLNSHLKESKEQILRQKDEVMQAKLRFFTNISHEFRTPLTLLKGPFERIKNSENKLQTLDKYLPIIQRNINGLLNLLNEIMDFRKLETGNLPLLAEKVEIIAMAKDIVLSFSELAKEKNIELKINCKIDHQEIWVDRSKFAKILYNLLSNAFKNTNTSGQILVFINTESLTPNPMLQNQLIINNGKALNSNFLEIVVEDTGIGISKNSIANIFDRYYQVGNPSNPQKHQGTGLGLNIIKQLVQLHQGNLIVNSERDIGTRFTLRFPLGTNHLNPDQLKHNPDANVEILQNVKQEEENTQNSASDVSIIEKNKILIVEDNDDVRVYLRDLLINDYNIEEAGDGIKGWNMALSHYPEIIISDVMMPGMNGIELCNKLKMDIRTSHIPIILLSALSSIENQIQGLKMGADIYISKPIDESLIQLHIKNLIRNRNKLFRKMQDENEVDMKTLIKNPVDEAFLQKIKDIIEQNITDVDFKVDELSREIGMSRKNLYIKIKALLGIGASELIRNIKLEKAKKLLTHSNNSISEIAFLTGFSSHSHLGKCFKEKYNISPSEFKKNS